MPTVHIQNIIIPTLSKDIDYDFGDETLSSITKKYDSKINTQNTNLVIGDTFFEDWNVSIEACLFYGDSISIHTYKIEMNVQFDGKQKIIQMETNQKIKELQYEIEQSFDVRFAEVKFRSDIHELTDHSKTLRYYGLNNSSVINVFDFKIDEIKQHSIAIFIDTLSNQTIQFLLRNTITVLMLKGLIQAQTGIPPDHQRLIFNGEKLVESHRLYEYDIKTGSHLNLCIRLSGGGCSFADLCQQPKKFGWNKKAPKWRVAKIGLCLEGKCVNKKCKAFNKMVIINMGVPIIFKLGLPSVNNPTNCPMCESYVKPLTCGFNNCEYRYLAVKETDKGLEKIKSEWVEIGNDYNRFDEDKQSDYCSLVIETRCPQWGNSSYSATYDIDCKFCLDKKRDYSNSTKDGFHQSCKDDFIKCMAY